MKPHCIVYDSDWADVACLSHEKGISVHFLNGFSQPVFFTYVETVEKTPHKKTATIFQMWILWWIFSIIGCDWLDWISTLYGVSINIFKRVKCLFPTTVKPVNLRFIWVATARFEEDTLHLRLFSCGILPDEGGGSRRDGVKTEPLFFFFFNDYVVRGTRKLSKRSNWQMSILVNMFILLFFIFFFAFF